MDENDKYEKTDYLAAKRAIQRYLKRQGFLRRRRSGPANVSQEHIARRNKYIRTLLQNRSKPPH